MKSKLYLMILVCLVVSASILNYSETYVDIYEELKTDHPEVVSALKSEGATDQVIEKFLTELATEVSKTADLNESNIDTVLKAATKTVLFESPGSSSTKPEYQTIGMAYLVPENKTSLRDSTELQDVIKRKILSVENPNTGSPSTSTGGGGVVGGGGAPAATTSTETTTPEPKNNLTRTESGKLEISSEMLLSQLKATPDKSVKFVVEKADLLKGETLDLKSLDTEALKSTKVDLDLGDISVTVMKQNRSELSNKTLSVKYDQINLSVAFDTDNKDLMQPVLFKMPLSKDLQRSGLTVAKLNADGTYTPVGGFVVGDTIKFFTDKAGTYKVIQNKVEFKDLKLDDYWAAQKVESLASLGVISGKGDGTFDPAAPITRAEFAALITKMMKYDNATESASFLDVDQNQWYAPYVKTANAFGLMNGKGDAQFDPNGEITQQEILTVLSKVLTDLDVEKGTIESKSSIDMKIQSASTWAKDSVVNAISNGALNGMPLGNIELSRSATRLETANMLYEVQSALFK